MHNMSAPVHVLLHNHVQQEARSSHHHMQQYIAHDPCLVSQAASGPSTQVWENTSKAATHSQHSAVGGAPVQQADLQCKHGSPQARAFFSRLSQKLAISSALLLPATCLLQNDSNASLSALWNSELLLKHSATYCARPHNQPQGLGGSNCNCKAKYNAAKCKLAQRQN